MKPKSKPVEEKTNGNKGGKEALVLSLEAQKMRVFKALCFLDYNRSPEKVAEEQIDMYIEMMTARFPGQLAKG